MRVSDASPIRLHDQFRPVVRLLLYGDCDSCLTSSSALRLAVRSRQINLINCSVLARLITMTSAKGMFLSQAPEEKCNHQSCTALH